MNAIIKGIQALSFLGIAGLAGLAGFWKYELFHLGYLSYFSYLCFIRFAKIKIPRGNPTVLVALILPAVVNLAFPMPSSKMPFLSLIGFLGYLGFAVGRNKSDEQNKLSNILLHKDRKHCIL